MQKLVAIGSCMGAPAYFKNLFEEVQIIGYKDRPETVVDKNTVIMYGGGEDISPALYGQIANRVVCHAPSKPSLRDMLETEYYDYGNKVGAKHFGICRGAQILCALSGGTLWQDVENHGRTHKAFLTPEVRENKELFRMVDKPGLFDHAWNIEVTSTHHQMVKFESLKAIYPDAIPLLVSEPRSEKYYTENGYVLKRGVSVDNEGFYIPSLKVMGVQGHPEFSNLMSPFAQLCRLFMLHLMKENNDGQSK